MKVIVLIHEIYGVTGNLLKLKELLEGMGYRVLCPSLYPDGYVSGDEAKCYTKFYDEIGLDGGKKVIEKIMADGGDDEYILIGFSVGATIAWLESRHKRVSKVICVYGSRIRDYLNVKPTAKAHLLFCREKSFNIDLIRDGLKDNPAVYFKEIKGGHGFYGKLDFADSLVQDLNGEILKTLSE